MSDSPIKRFNTVEEKKDVGNPHHPVPHSIMRYLSECLYDYLITQHIDMNDKGVNTTQGKDFEFRWYNADGDIYHEPLTFVFPFRLLDVQVDLLPIMNLIATNIVSPSWSNYFIVIIETKYSINCFYNVLQITYKTFPKKKNVNSSNFVI